MGVVGLSDRGEGVDQHGSSVTCAQFSKRMVTSQRDWRPSASIHMGSASSFIPRMPSAGKSSPMEWATATRAPGFGLSAGRISRARVAVGTMLEKGFGVAGTARGEDVAKGDGGTVRRRAGRPPALSNGATTGPPNNQMP